jgi:hypothetical protein
MGKNGYRLAIAIFAAVLVWNASEAAAQTVGTFRWQYAPFCNVVTLTVVQTGDGFALTGYDDRCGASVRSAVSGAAHLNPDGTVGIGLTGVRPDGFSTLSSVTLSLISLSGTWSDAYGASGSFLFNPVNPAGPPRTITIRGTYGIDAVAPYPNADSLTPISFGLTLPVAPSAPAANFLAEGAAPTASCPGTAANPEAAPGHLCVYERSSSNVSTRCIVPSGEVYECTGVASRSGAGLYIQATAALRMISMGTWAVTIP